MISDFQGEVGLRLCDSFNNWIFLNFVKEMGWEGSNSFFVKFLPNLIFNPILPPLPTFMNLTNFEIGSGKFYIRQPSYTLQIWSSFQFVSFTD